MSIINRITTKTVVGGGPGSIIPKRQLPDDGQKIMLMRVYGTAHRCESGSTDLGAYIKVKGRFEAEALWGKNKGQRFESANLILPDVASDLVEAQLASMEAGTIDLAFDIGIRGNDSSVTGYTFFAESLIKATATDSLALLRDSLPELPALPDNSGDGESDPESETEPVTKSTKKTTSRRSRG